MLRTLLHLLLGLVLFLFVFYLFKLGFAHRPDGSRVPVFMAVSQSHHYRIAGEIPKMYESRWLACNLSSRWFDFWQPNPSSWNEGGICFALYNALWVLLLFLVLILTLPEAWIPMLGVTAGLMGNSIPSWPPYFLPWDMPATFFFTAAYLCYRKKSWLVLIAILLAGALMKETVLLCALLFLNAPWKRNLRFLAMIGVIALAMILTKLMMPTNISPAWYFSISEWLSNFHWNSLFKLWPVIFVNAGGLIVLLVCLTKLRDWPLRLVVAAFIIGQCLNDIGYGVYVEFRVWCELLPLGWILFSDFIFKNKADRSPREENQIAVHQKVPI